MTLVPREIHRNQERHVRQGFQMVIAYIAIGQMVGDFQMRIGLGQFHHMAAELANLRHRGFLGLIMLQFFLRLIRSLLSRERQSE